MTSALPFLSLARTADAELGYARVAGADSSQALLNVYMILLKDFE